MSYADYVHRLSDKYRDLMQCAASVQKAVVEKRAAAGPAPGDPVTVYVKGDMVLVRPPLDYSGKPKVPKMSPHWLGPFAVRERVGPSRYLIENIQKPEEVMECHVDRLKPFVNGSDREPAEIAGWDANEFVVERIIDARGPKGGLPRNQLQFLICWRGYGPESDTWEPFTTVSDLEALDVFAPTRPDLHLLEGECGARRGRRRVRSGRGRGRPRIH